MLLAVLVLGLFTLAFGAKDEKSPCEAELANIAFQPQNCAYEYLERAARHVHDPQYRWFAEDVSAVAAEFYGDYFVGVEVVNAAGYGIAGVTPSGRVYSSFSNDYYYYDIMRTMGTGLKTHFRSDDLTRYFITQLIWGPYGQLYIITVNLPFNDFINID